MADGPADSTEVAKGATDPLLAAVGSRILAVRLSKGIGVTEAAAAARMNKGHWWRIEAGEHNLSLKVLARVATALNTDMSDLLSGVTVFSDGPRKSSGPMRKRAAERDHGSGAPETTPPQSEARPMRESTALRTATSTEPAGDGSEA